MDENNIQQNPTSETSSETFGSVPNSSEDLSETFRKENHTLSVRDVVKLFEEKGVDITERSIVNYCHPNKYGVSLLDSYYDQNERKHFISLESVEKAIVEVRARKIKTNDISANVPKTSETRSETFGSVPNSSETNKKETSNEDVGKMKQLERKVEELEILKEASRQIIEGLREDKKELVEERKEFVTMMRDDLEKIGSLKNQVRQLEAPKNSPNLDENTNEYRTVDVEQKNPIEEQNEGN